MPAISAPGSQTAPAAVNPSLRNACPPVFIRSANSARPPLSLADSGAVPQAHPLPLEDRRAPAAVAAVQLGATAGQLATDLRQRQPDRPSCGEPLAGPHIAEEHATAGLDPVGDQRVAVAVLAGQPGAVADESARDLRFHQPDRPSRGEPAVEQHIPTGSYPVSDQRVAPAVDAVQLGTAAYKLAGNLRSHQRERASEV